MPPNNLIDEFKTDKDFKPVIGIITLPKSNYGNSGIFKF
jgi:hypothetical protein